MKSIFSKHLQEPLHILVVGNNPIEMSSVLDKLHQVRHRNIITEIAFDIKSTLERLVKFNPNFILIDDNLGKNELRETVNTLSASKKTKHVPITVLKNSNYRETFASDSILDYLLKQNLSTDSLYNTIKNSLRLKRTQRLLLKVYKTKKGILRRISETSTLNLIG